MLGLFQGSDWTGSYVRARFTLRASLLGTPRRRGIACRLLPTFEAFQGNSLAPAGQLSSHAVRCIPDPSSDWHQLFVLVPGRLHLP